jgi:hypothetical protein
MRRGVRHATHAISVLAVVLALGACGSSDGGASGGQPTSTGEVVDLGGGAEIQYPDQAPNGTVTPEEKGADRKTPAATQATTRWRSALTDALAAGRREADALGGRTDAAIWASGWTTPVISGDPARRARLWSMFKPIAALAALRAAAAAGTQGGSAETRAAIELALRRSDNCAARRMVLSLQQLAGGPEAAGEQVRAILISGGAQAEIATRTGPADDVCRAYLQRSKNLDDPLAPGLQLGTSTWSVRDAVTFAHALGSGFYGADGTNVQTWMRAPKSRAAQVPADQYTVRDPEWGAGRALRERDPAFKGGWGGTQQDRFVAGQIATFDVGKVRIAMAVYFHPNKQPTLDDPGQTSAPAALEAVFARVDTTLRRLTAK